MYTVSSFIEEKVIASPHLEDLLNKDLINLSSLARYLKPEMDTGLLKDIKVGTIVMALKRYSATLKKKKTFLKPKSFIVDMTVKLNLMEITLTNSLTLMGKQTELMNLVKEQQDIFLNQIQGGHETTIIVSQQIQKEVEKIFKNEQVIWELNNISAIVLKLTEETAIASGIYYEILKRLAWESINVAEFISTTHELVMLFSNNDIEKAFSLLRPFA